ncbi:hypothetical protein H4R35_001689 [Dimargaris xerosporica]|nr:hypothetical protein H4R35_001689 [Dimargaris xerosporica]
MAGPKQSGTGSSASSRKAAAGGSNGALALVPMLSVMLPVMGVSFLTTAVVQQYALLTPLEWFVEKFVDADRVALAALAFNALWTYKATAMIANFVAGWQEGAVELREPRRQKSQLTGCAARAYAAHLNAIESFPLFTTAVLMAYVTEVDVNVRNSFALIHVLARITHTTAYIADIGLLRALSYFSANAASFYLVGFAVFRNFNDLYQYCFSFIGAAKQHASEASVKAGQAASAVTKTVAHAYTAAKGEL